VGNFTGFKLDSFANSRSLVAICEAASLLKFVKIDNYYSLQKVFFSKNSRHSHY
jgi:hypothetical protein